MSTITSWMISFPYIFMVSGMAILHTYCSRCANAAAGISDGCVVVQGIMPQPPCIERSADACFDEIEPG